MTYSKCMYSFKSNECNYRGDLPDCNGEEKNCRNNNYNTFYNMSKEEVNEVLKKISRGNCEA